MNSFIGISKAQTTNLAVVAPGIAEALLATAIGLIAPIPPDIIYNHFSRATKAYLENVGRGSGAVGRLLSRDLDRSHNRPLACVAEYGDGGCSRRSRRRRRRGFRRGARHQCHAFIDVMLVLLIIFMIAALLSTAADRSLISQRFRSTWISSNLASARSNLSLNSHMASRISRKVAEVLALSACPKVKTLLLRKYPMMVESEIT